MPEQRTLTICYSVDDDGEGCYDVFDGDEYVVIGWASIPRLQAALIGLGYVTTTALDPACRQARETGRAEITVMWREP